MRSARNGRRLSIYRSTCQQHRHDRAALCAARQNATASEMDQQAVVFVEELCTAGEALRGDQKSALQSIWFVFP